VNPERSRFAGTVLLLIGLLALAGTSPLLRLLPSFVWLVLMLAVGAGVWTMGGRRLPFVQRILLYAGTGIFATVTTGRFSGTAATGFIALAFILVYLDNPRRWWALLPGGVMAANSLVLAVGAFFPRWDVGPLFMLALAGTFTTLYLLPDERGGQRWARFPASATILITLIMNDPSGQSPGWLVPLLLLGSGVGILWWFRRQQGRR
jgi:hypothetical protein